jgi:hypothetical protein
MMLFQAACSAIAGQMLPVSSRSRAYTKLDRGYDHPKQTDRAKHWPSCWRLLRKCQSAPRELPRSAAAGDASDDDGRRLERDRRADSAVGTATTLGEPTESDQPTIATAANNVFNTVNMGLPPFGGVQPKPAASPRPVTADTGERALLTASRGAAARNMDGCHTISAAKPSSPIRSPSVV